MNYHYNSKLGAYVFGFNIPKIKISKRFKYHYDAAVKSFEDYEQYILTSKNPCPHMRIIEHTCNKLLSKTASLVKTVEDSSLQEDLVQFASSIKKELKRKC